VDVEDAVRERGEELRLHDAHEAGERDDLGAVRAEVLDVAVLGGALELRLERRGVEVVGGDAVPAGAVEDLRVGDVRDDADDPRVELAAVDRVLDGLHVRAGAGAEHADVKCGGHGGKGKTGTRQQARRMRHYGTEGGRLSSKKEPRRGAEICEPNPRRGAKKRRDACFAT